MEELLAYYDKSLRSPRIVTMGHAESRSDFMHEDPFRRIRYRQGIPSSEHDMQTVDGDRAKRIILLAPETNAPNDAAMISQVLSARRLNPTAFVLAEIDSDMTEAAALLAGGQHTVAISTRRLMASLLANLTLGRGNQALYGQLLSSAGHEIYTYFLDKPDVNAQPIDFDALFDCCLERHNITLIGLITSSGKAVHATCHIAPTTRIDKPIVGYIGIAQSFTEFREAVDTLLHVGPSPVTQRTAVRMESPREDPHTILVCGYNAGTVALCDQLLLNEAPTNITIVVANAIQLKALRQLFICSVPIHAPETSNHVAYAATDDDLALSFILPKEAGQGSIRLVIADWATPDALERGIPERDLSTFDRIILDHCPDEADPDARTALCLLNLLLTAERSRTALHPQLEIFGSVYDEEKADLLAARFADQHPPSTVPITILGAQRTRNALLAQATFVPSIPDIYTQLLGPLTPNIRCMRIFPNNGSSTMSYGDIARSIWREHRAITVGLESAGNLLINAPPSDPVELSTGGALIYVIR